MKTLELEKSQAFIVIKIIEYVPDSGVSKTIIRKTMGNVSAVSFGSGEKVVEKTSSTDTLIQVIDGDAEFIINGESNNLKAGQSMVIPAHSDTKVNADFSFKMISTVIKNGHKEVN